MKRILSLIGVVLVVGCGPPDGSIEEVDLPDGPYETYHDNGQLLGRGTIKDGEFDGPFEGYWDNGQLMTKMTYKDGVQEGPFEGYWDNGQLSIKGIWKDGEECGEWLEFGETVTYDPC